MRNLRVLRIGLAALLLAAFIPAFVSAQSASRLIIVSSSVTRGAAGVTLNLTGQQSCGVSIRSHTGTFTLTGYASADNGASYVAITGLTAITADGNYSAALAPFGGFTQFSLSVTPSGGTVTLTEWCSGQIMPGITTAFPTPIPFPSVQTVTFATPVPVTGAFPTPIPFPSVQAVIATSGTATRTSVASSATLVSLLASNASRRGCNFYNESTATLYLVYGSGGSATDYTVQIPSQSFFECPVPVYTGAIGGIWSSANGNVRITEL
jgi:hypothetical protein